MSCASMGPNIGTSDELDSYVAAFDKEIVDHGNVWVVFDEYPEDSSVLGTCYYIPLGTNYVTVNEKEWDKLSYMERKALIIHELLHCVCDLGHTIEISEIEELGVISDVDRFEDGCVKDLMYPYIVSHTCMTDHHDDYMKLAKKRCMENK